MPLGVVSGDSRQVGNQYRADLLQGELVTSVPEEPCLVLPFPGQAHITACPPPRSHTFSLDLLTPKGGAGSQFISKGDFLSSIVFVKHGNSEVSMLFEFLNSWTVMVIVPRFGKCNQSGTDFAKLSYLSLSEDQEPLVLSSPRTALRHAQLFPQEVLT